MSTPSWAELDRRQRRREVITTSLTVVLVWVILFGIYYLVPFTDRTSGESLLRLVLGDRAVHRRPGVAGAPHHASRSPRAACRPGARRRHPAVPRGLRRRLPTRSRQASATNFSEPLNHTGALYLTITIFSTVGFGDITPEADLARIAVSIQMLLDLVVIGAVVRLLTSAAKPGTQHGLH